MGWVAQRGKEGKETGRREGGRQREGRGGKAGGRRKGGLLVKELWERAAKGKGRDGGSLRDKENCKNIIIEIVRYCKAGKKIQSFWNCIVTDGIRSSESLPLKYQTNFESTDIKRSCI